MRLNPLKRQALAVGVFVTALQLALAFGLSPKHHPKEVYSNLCHWDCAWYSSIARDGYHSPVPPVAQKPEISNVAFFPAFPYMARAAHLGIGIKPETALVAIAQIFAVVFWAALWMILRTWKISTQGAILVIMAILAHPAIFFLITGYSESLFLGTLLIFILSSQRRKARSTPMPSVAGAVSGITMSATRIVGMPVSFFPLMAGLSSQALKRRALSLSGLSAATITSLIASIGTIGFLIYCQLRFGRYDLYMETQRIGWGIQPDYGAILKWKEFLYTYEFDKVATILSGWAFVFFAVFEASLLLFRKSRGFACRLPIYAVSFLIFFVTISGLKSLGFRSMIRYTLPWHVLLLLCFAHILSKNLPRSPRLLNLCVGLGLFAALIAIRVYGLPHFADFLNSRWFA